MADRTYRRSRYERGGEPRYERQAEQFESDHGWRDQERGYRQMGEAHERDDDYGQFEVGGQPYTRERDYSRDRDSWRRDDEERSRGGTSYAETRYSPSIYSERGTGGFASFNSNDYGGSDFSDPRYGAGRQPYTGYGAYSPGYGAGMGGRSASRGGYSDRDERGWFERAGDEVASWFGDEDAARRRERDHTGRGPSGYTRSDDRILEDACDTLTRDWRVDATNVQVTVRSGEVTLDGTVTSRNQKRRAEDIVEDLSGVKHVQNNLRIPEQGAWDRNNTGSAAAGREKAG